MPNSIDVTFQFLCNAKLAGGMVEIPENATVQDFKDQIRGRYLGLNLDNYSVIYKRQLQENSVQFSRFFSEAENQNVYLVTASAEVDFKWSDHPELGGNSIDIPITFSVSDFKNAIKSQYNNLNLNLYCVIYNGSVIGNSKYFWEFWSEDPVREIHIARDSVSGLS